MSKPLKLNLNDLSSSHYLPDIKSQKSAPTSPRIGFQANLTPMAGNQADSSRPEDLLITKLAEKKQKIGNSIKKLTQNQVSKKQYTGLLKFVKEREEYIEVLEKQLQEINETTKVKVEEKYEVSFKERSPKFHVGTPKNCDLIKLRGENEDLKDSIEKLTKRIFEQKLKLEDLESQKEKQSRKIEIIEKTLEIKNIELQSLHHKLQENKSSEANKSEDLQDLERLLKISEDKRKVAIEQVITMEKRLFQIQSKNFNITNSQNELKSSLDDLTRNLLSKETELKDSLEQNRELQKKIRKEKDLASGFKTELEMIRVNMKTNEDFFKGKIDEITKENIELRETLNKSLQHIRKNVKRAGTVAGSKYLDDYSEQETMRWQQKFFESEEKLALKSFELERVRKDDIYLHSQIDMKNSLIERLNKVLLETGDHSNSHKARSSSLPFDSHQELTELIDKLLNQNDLLADNFRCSNCTSTSSPMVLLHPCQHIHCPQCQDADINICKFCNQSILQSISLSLLSLFSNHLKSQSTSLKHLKLMLNSLSF